MRTKIDFYGQIFLASLIALSTLSCLVYPGAVIIALLGMIPLGIWQLISAAMHTYRLQQLNKKPLLQTYWRIALITLLALTICFFIDGASDLFSIIFIVTVLAGFATAVYYLYVYKKYLFKL